MGSEYICLFHEKKNLGYEKIREILISKLLIFDLTKFYNRQRTHMMEEVTCNSNIDFNLKV
ncbi:hypothetical protein MTR_0027s0130 [Medicago truncatula]|uniref:Uncharacterized protein n=1 Tax=Medicago truncatula TaxID=3880 RepID=A0A072TJA4_MEDTR|nr:hypothetical protein MTR_0027s0130 [Medicago truncatula]